MEICRGGASVANRSLKFCAHAGCDELVTFGYCEKHRAEYEARERDKTKLLESNRKSASERGYDSRWQKARRTYLAHHPLCAECQRQGKLTPATVVDHIVPHKGDRHLFWDKSNWQSLCKSCHDSKTAKEDGRWGK